MLTALCSQNCLRSQFILFYEPVILLFHRRIDANQGRLCCPVSDGAFSFIISLCHYYTTGCFRMQAAIFHKECYAFSCIRQNFLFSVFQKLTFRFGRGRMNVFGGFAAGVGAVHGAAPIFYAGYFCKRNWTVPITSLSQLIKRSVRVSPKVPFTLDHLASSFPSSFSIHPPSL